MSALYSHAYLPRYDLVVYDSNFHSDELIEHLLHYILLIDKPEAGRLMREIRALGKSTVLTTHFERAEHYAQLLHEKSVKGNLLHESRGLSVEYLLVD